MGRRIDVESDDVLQLGRELGVLGQLEALDPVRLQSVRGPDPLHRAQRYTGRRGHGPARPVGRFAGWLAEGQLDHPLDHRFRQRRLPGGRLLSRSSPSTPAVANRSCQRQTVALAQPTWRMIEMCRTVAGQQHDPRPFDMLLPAVPIRHDRFEPSTTIGGNLDFDPLAHAWQSTSKVLRDSYDRVSALAPRLAFPDQIEMRWRSPPERLMPPLVLNWG